jgi:microcin C transport system permease protein
LVVFTLIIGIAIGAIQGYFGGKIDLLGQRLIEIWSALPFLYIMIYLGNILAKALRYCLLFTGFSIG